MSDKTYTGTDDLLEVRDFLLENYNLEQVGTLAKKMGTNLADLPGERIGDKVRELITYCKRRGMGDNLLLALTQSPVDKYDGTVTTLQVFQGNQRNIWDVYDFLAHYTKKTLYEIASSVGLDPDDIVGKSTRTYAENLADSCNSRGKLGLLIQKMQA